MGRNPSTFVIGSGKVATTFAGGLRLAGVPVLGLWGRRPDGARKAGGQAGVAFYSAAPPDLLLESDVVIVAVSDGAISEVAEMLVGTGLIGKRHVLVHCSGVMSASEAFGGVLDRVGGVGTMHPLRAVANPAQAIAELKETVFGVEGDSLGLAVVKELVRVIGGDAIELRGEQMTAYHAAAAMASNYAVALLGAASSVLEKAGLSRSQAVAALTPLMAGSVKNISEGDLSGALTGPIVRGDLATVKRHLGNLPAELQGIYRHLGVMAVSLAKERQTHPENLDEIADLLRSSQ